MPIHPENKARYPDDWDEISQKVKDEAGWCCECEGECGQHDGVCGVAHGQPAPWSGSTVILTTAHLDHVPEHCDPSNLRAMCQRCHLSYDREHHRQSKIRREREAMEAAGQQTVFDDPTK